LFISLTYATIGEYLSARMVSSIICEGETISPFITLFKIDGENPEIRAVPVSSKETGMLFPLDWMFQ
jgi:hypothetical protein